MASDAKTTLDRFVDERRDATYAFDGERGAPRTTLCREGKDGKMDCVKLDMYTTQLFEALQSKGFYCALPSDPSRTHLECKPQRIPQP